MSTPRQCPPLALAGECSRVKALYLAMRRQHFLYGTVYLRSSTESFFPSFFFLGAHGMARIPLDQLSRHYIITLSNNFEMIHPVYQGRWNLSIDY